MYFRKKQNNPLNFTFRTCEWESLYGLSEKVQTIDSAVLESLFSWKWWEPHLLYLVKLWEWAPWGNCVCDILNNASLEVEWEGNCYVLTSYLLLASILAMAHSFSENSVKTEGFSASLRQYTLRGQTVLDCSLALWRVFRSHLLRSLFSHLFPITVSGPSLLCARKETRVRILSPPNDLQQIWVSHSC